MQYLFDFAIIIFLLLIGALTAASETAVIASSILKLKQLAGDGSKTAKIILKILETPERFFGTILVANNIVDALIASFLTAIIISAIKDSKQGVLLATILAAVLIIIFEVTAKTIAAKNPVRISLFLANAVKKLICILSPVVNILAWITNTILKLIGTKQQGKSALVIEDEIKALIKIGEQEGQHKDKYQMMSQVFKFSGTIVKNVMIPKDKMVCVDKNSNIDDILEQALESGYSRLPVYCDNIQNIIGVVNMKDLLNLALNRDLVILDDIIYQVIFVNESKKVEELLKEFQKGHTHLAIVVDSQKNILGLVTIEDLLEEIVGDIKDEYDIRSEK